MFDPGKLHSNNARSGVWDPRGGYAAPVESNVPSGAYGLLIRRSLVRAQVGEPKQASNGRKKPSPQRLGFFVWGGGCSLNVMRPSRQPRAASGLIQAAEGAG